MSRWLRSSQRHLVDRFGLVGCPRQGRDVSVEACLVCRELVSVEGDGVGSLTEIRCRAVPNRPAGQDAWDPYLPIGPVRW